jgi:hypothetical protein
MPIELQNDCFARGFREFGVRASGCGEDSQSCGSVIASPEKSVVGDCQIRSSYAKLHFVYFRGPLKEMFNKKPLIPSAHCAIGQNFSRLRCQVVHSPESRYDSVFSITTSYTRWPCPADPETLGVPGGDTYDVSANERSRPTPAA